VILVDYFGRKREEVLAKEWMEEGGKEDEEMNVMDTLMLWFSSEKEEDNADETDEDDEALRSDELKSCG
jgi:hypothetical protein